MAILCTTSKPHFALLDMKPLFIPLKSEYFYAFKSGEKDRELRASGGRWNERTCPIGRRVVLSKGYGKSERLNGVITDWSDMPSSRLSQQELKDFTACYGDKARVFAIGIELFKESV